jgi:hypothetical protein
MVTVVARDKNGVGGIVGLFTVSVGYRCFPALSVVKMCKSHFCIDIQMLMDDDDSE